MARQGISTGTSPNSGTGDTLLAGGVKINENFTEIYTLLGDGTTLDPGIVTSILSDDNISLGSSTGQVSIGLSENIVVTGVSTLGVVTGATYYGDGSNLTGLSTQLSQFDNNTGFVTFTNNNQLVNGAGFISSLDGVDGSGLTGIVTNITLVNSGVTTSTNGFISAASTSACQITFSGNQLTFNVPGVGSTTFTLS